MSCGSIREEMGLESVGTREKLGREAKDVIKCAASKSTGNCLVGRTVATRADAGSGE